MTQMENVSSIRELSWRWQPEIIRVEFGGKRAVLELRKTCLWEMTPLVLHLWHYQWQCPYCKPGNLTHRQETQVGILGPDHLAWAVVLSLKKAKLILFGSTFFLSRNRAIHTIEVLLQLVLIFLVNMGNLKIWWKLWRSIIQIPNFATRQALY